MPTAKNMVIAGDYTGCRLFRYARNQVYISGTMSKMEDIQLTPETVTRFELMTEDVIRSGNSLLLTGPLDPGNLLRLRLHASEAMQKKGIYTIALKFDTFKQSLIEIDEKLYTAFMRRMSEPPAD